MSQSICAITSIAGPAEGYTFVLAAAGNGFTAGEIQPTTTASPIVYSSAFPSNIQAARAKNTCFCFLPNLSTPTIRARAALQAGSIRRCRRPPRG